MGLLFYCHGQLSHPHQDYPQPELVKRLEAVPLRCRLPSPGQHAIAYQVLSEGTMSRLSALSRVCRGPWYQGGRLAEPDIFVGA